MDNGNENDMDNRQQEIKMLENVFKLIIERIGDLNMSMLKYQNKLGYRIIKRSLNRKRRLVLKILKQYWW
jgi:hypothetical protein